jgi:tetratricopeptide (TPR) repeat protein
MKIDKLKEKARRKEQEEEWGKAMALYSQALARSGEEDEPDISLHNRIGDLQVRIGDLEGAVESYERAIELYLEADLANNALAVCRKLERNAPGRPSVLLRMGQIRVRQGFVGDARQDFIGYAELQLAQGDAEEALRALEEFAALAPDDVEIRLLLANQLKASDREGEAVRHLQRTYQLLKERGDEEGAETVRSELAELAPELDPDDFDEPSSRESVPTAQEGHEGDLMGFEATSLSEVELDAADEIGADRRDADPEEDVLDAPATEDGPQETRPKEDAGEPERTEDDGWGADPLSGTTFQLDAEHEEVTELEESDALLEDPDAPLQPPVREGGERPGLEFEEIALSSAGGEDADEDAFIGMQDLPLLTDEEQFEEAPHGEEAEHAVHPEETNEFSDPRVVADLDPLPVLEEPGPDSAPVADGSEDAEWGDGEESGEDALPVVGVGEEETEPDTLPGLRAILDANPRDADAWRRLGVLLFDEGLEKEARNALARAHRAYGSQDEPERAMRVVRELIFLEPDVVEHYQRLVEYAHRTRDRALLVPAFLELAEALDRQGSREKAEAVYGKVLALDPRNPRARRALSGGPRDEQARRREGFVSLGGLVLDEASEDSFRWKVPHADPTGDEEADFARMLSQFKEKVARNLPSDDAAAHYDLGAAYKDMGLLDEAIGQFQRAIRASRDHLASYEMLGQCFLEKGQPEVAIRTLTRALEAHVQLEDDLLGIYYYLAKAYEEVGNPKSAREFYERVFSLDINFMDVTERLRVLR